MNYDPQRRAPRSHPGDVEGDQEPSPVDALLDGPDVQRASTAGDIPAPASTRSETPPFSVVPEPTPPNADMWKLGVLGALATAVALVAAWRLRRWWSKKPRG